MDRKSIERYLLIQFVTLISLGVVVTIGGAIIIAKVMGLESQANTCPKALEDGQSRLRTRGSKIPLASGLQTIVKRCSCVTLNPKDNEQIRGRLETIEDAAQVLDVPIACCEAVTAGAGVRKEPDRYLLTCGTTPIEDPVLFGLYWGKWLVWAVVLAVILCLLIPMLIFKYGRLFNRGLA